MRCRRFSALLLALAMLLGALGCSRAAQDPAHWTCGWGEAEIRADDWEGKTYYIGGYRNGNRATGVLDWQKAKALYLDANDGNGGVLLIAVDCIGLTSTVVGQIRAALRPLAAEAGLQSIHVMSTHTHAGVDTMGLWGPIGETGVDELFMSRLFAAVTDAAWSAWTVRTDGALYLGVADVGGLLRDSRAPEVMDARLGSLRFEPESGAPGVRLLCVGAHPEALGGGNSKISADFPAHMAAAILRKTGEDIVFVAGAIGGAGQHRPAGREPRGERGFDRRGLRGGGAGHPG